jgi:hypothetical protein
MAILDRLRGRAPRQVPAEALVPEPRRPTRADAPGRCTPPDIPPARAHGLSAADHRGEQSRSLGERVELRGFYTRLVEVAVWTSPEGVGAEYATLLLHTRDRRWHYIGMAEPAAGELMLYLSQLPGFDRSLRRELVAQSCLSRIVILWRAGGPATEDAAVRP